MQLIDVALFLLVFVIVYAVLAVGVKIVHLITKDHSHTYRIAVIIFALLFAAMFTYNNLGRSGTKKYPKILQVLSTPTASPSPTESQLPTPTLTPEVSPTP